MKILVYGFKPYKKYKENITENIIIKIKNRKNLVKEVFTVKFEKNMFLEKIKRQNKKDKPKIIFKDKPKYRFTSLKLTTDENSRISYNAGKYVCNYSMYVILDYCQNKTTEFAFIHVPKGYNLDKAVKFVESKINELDFS